MSDYKFFAGYMRFVATKTPRDSAEIAEMMDELARIAASLEATGGFSVAGDKLDAAARAFAGIAGFLQQQILPEVVAAQNPRGEAQVRWVIDTSMTLMGSLRAAAERGDHDPATKINLPSPPDAEVD